MSKAIIFAALMFVSLFLGGASLRTTHLKHNVSSLSHNQDQKAFQEYDQFVNSDEACQKSAQTGQPLSSSDNQRIRQWLKDHSEVAKPSIFQFQTSKDNKCWNAIDSAKQTLLLNHMIDCLDFTNAFIGNGSPYPEDLYGLLLPKVQADSQLSGETLDCLNNLLVQVSSLVERPHESTNEGQKAEHLQSSYSHKGVSDENIPYSYSNSVRQWSGMVERTFTNKQDGNVCRKYTLQKTLNYRGRNYIAEIGINHSCYCWFTCIDSETPVMQGNPASDYAKANGKWCYGNRVKENVLRNVGLNRAFPEKSYATWGLLDFTRMDDQQARNVIRDFCADAKRCQQTCS